MKLVRKKLLALAILTTALSAHAQIRAWAFSKDTVYEWASNGDTVSLVNNRTDTLKFDSIGLELVRPTSTHFQVRFQTAQSGSLLDFNQGKIITVASGNLFVAAGQTKPVFQFQVEDRIVRTAKSSAIVQGDTLLVRMIFMASAGGGRDTLMLKGKQNLPLALRLPGNRLKSFSFDDRLFDLRGRRMEKIPEGLKAPWAPLVSPRE
jgi:hypothetical protein